jgi:hypothetical protein
VPAPVLRFFAFRDIAKALQLSAKVFVLFSQILDFAHDHGA